MSCTVLVLLKQYHSGLELRKTYFWITNCTKVSWIRSFQVLSFRCCLHAISSQVHIMCCLCAFVFRIHLYVIVSRNHFRYFALEILSHILLQIGFFCIAFTKLDHEIKLCLFLLWISFVYSFPEIGSQNLSCIPFTNTFFNMVSCNCHGKIAYAFPSHKFIM